MKNANSYMMAAFALILTMSVACSPQRGADGINGSAGINGTDGISGSDGVNGVNGINGTNGVDGTSPALTGTSSGGGGFVDENSTLILAQAAQGLAQQIRAASPLIFKNFPKNMNQEKMAKIIEGVVYLPNEERQSEGSSKMFDWGSDENGEYIVALKPFFVAYSSYPIKFAEEKDRANLMRDVRLKLAHEFAHHLGIGTTKASDPLAERFGVAFTDAIANDNLHCMGTEKKSWPLPKKEISPGSSADTSGVRYEWTFHRPSGVGVFANSEVWSYDMIRTFNTGIGEYFDAYVHAGKEFSKDHSLDRETSRHIYPWTSQRTADGSQVFTALFPEGEDVQSEILTISPNGTASFAFIPKGETEPQVLKVKCESNAQALNVSDFN